MKDKKRINNLYVIALFLVLGILILLALNAHIYSIHKNDELTIIEENHDFYEKYIADSINQYFATFFIDVNRFAKDEETGSRYNERSMTEKRNFINAMREKYPEIKVGLSLASDRVMEFKSPSTGVNELQYFSAKKKKFCTSFPLGYEINSKAGLIKLDIPFKNIRGEIENYFVFVVELSMFKDKIIPQVLRENADIFMVDINGEIVMELEERAKFKDSDIDGIVSSLITSYIRNNTSDFNTRVINSDEYLISVLDITEEWKLIVMDNVDDISIMAFKKTFNELAVVQILIISILLVFSLKMYSSLQNWVKDEKEILLNRVMDLEEKSERNERLNTLYKEIHMTSKMPTILVDPEMKQIIDANDMAAKQLGYEAVELRGRSIEDVFFSEEIQEDFLFDKMGLGNEYEIQCDYLKKNREFARINVFMNMVEIEKHLLSVFYLEEVNQTAQCQNVPWQTETKSECAYIAKANHEMRAPLQGISGMLGLLNKTELSAEQLEYVKMLKVSSENMKAIMNEFLDLNDLETTTTELHKNEFELEFLIRTIVKPYELNNEKNIELNCHFSKDMINNLHGDELKLQHVISNLVENAYKYTDGGRIDIFVDTERLTDKVKFRFLISDTGIGISDDRIYDIFNEFTRDEERVNNRAGSGLGLAIVKEYVEMMGGEIQVTSKSTVGSTFEFFVLLEQGKVTNYNVAEKAEESSDGLGMLIVDDDEISRKYLSKLIEKLFKCKVEVAEDGISAINLLKNNKYSCLLLDCEMPELNGKEVASQVRNSAELTLNKNMVIVAITAETRKKEKELIFDTGVNYIMNKPVDESELTEVLNNFLSKENAGFKREYIEISIINKSIDIVGKDTMNEMIAIFLSESNRKLNRISALFNENDIDGLVKAIHKLKGSVSYFRPKFLVDDLLEIEEQLMRGELLKARSNFKTFSEGFRRLQKELSGVMEYINTNNVS